MQTTTEPTSAARACRPVPRSLWALAGLLAGAAGLASSYLTSSWLGLRGNPVTDVAELVIKLTPGKVAESAIQAVGHQDKPLLVTGVLVFLLLVFAAVGLLSRRSTSAAVGVLTVVAVVGLVAQQSQYQAPPTGIVPLVVGFVTWVAVLAVLGARLTPQPFRDTDPRRRFVLTAGLVTLGSLAVGLLGWKVGGRRRAVDTARQALQLPGVAPAPVPHQVEVPTLEGIAPWQTPTRQFYRIDTSLSPPAIAPQDWSVRIHGMVDREITLTFDDLLKRKRTQAWVTLNCVSNTVGGPLIGNAWWSGVRLKDLLEEAGVQAGADAVKQTSDDGWTCGTPLSALMDGRDAMLAVAMNAQPLAIEHGFPVRTIVPGLYGYVSACKWVRDIEVTTFSAFTAYWTARGWSEQGPVKLASRIDVPGDGGYVKAGPARVGGFAWQQDIGIKGVEVQLDRQPWQPAHVGRATFKDAWAQWDATLQVPAGHHTLRVRAINRKGQVQTGVQAQPVPDGVTGWHSISFTAR